MRPLLFGSDSTQELRIACERLHSAFRPRSQRTQLCDLRARAKSSEPLGALAIIAFIVLGAAVLRFRWFVIQPITVCSFGDSQKNAKEFLAGCRQAWNQGVVGAAGSQDCGR